MAPGGENDNPTVRSRPTDYLACAFPNGAIAIAPHYRHHEEAWPGGFFRDLEQDEQIVREHPLPADTIDLVDWRCRLGRQSPIAAATQSPGGATTRDDWSGLLAASAPGSSWTGMPGSGPTSRWILPGIRWGLQHATDDYSPLFRVWCGSAGKVHVPLGVEDAAGVEVWLGAALPTIAPLQQETRGRAGYGERQLPLRLTNGDLVLEVDAAIAGHWLYIVRRRR